MTDAEPMSEIDRLRAFEQRMQAEGAAAFADGPDPWEQWRRPKSGENPTWERHHENQDKNTKSMCERLLTGMAGVAVVALATGIGGIWMTTDTSNYMAANSVQPEPIIARPAASGTLLPDAVIRRDLPASLDELDEMLLEPLPGPYEIEPYSDTLASRSTNSRATSNQVTIMPDMQTPTTAVVDKQASTATIDPSSLTSADSYTSTNTNTNAYSNANSNINSNPNASSNTNSNIISSANANANARINALPAPGTSLAIIDTNNAADTIETLEAPAAGTSRLAVAATAEPAADITADITPVQASMIAEPVKPATGSQQANGPWSVNISAYADLALAEEKVEEFRAKGVIAEIVPITSNGKNMHRIRVSGYDNKREAITWVSLLEERLGIDGAWVSKR